MKHLLASIAMLYSMYFVAQPNPDLFQTWYLESFYGSDFSPEFIVADISPAITPTLIIDSNLDFNGTGACNAFNGTFDVPFPDQIQSTQFSSLTDDCGVTIHNSFEDEYFGFLQSVSMYQITSEPDGQVLQLSTMVFGQGVFKSATLNKSELDVNNIEIFPNPSSSIISVKSQENSILKVEIYNLYGQSVYAVSNQFETIEISHITPGVYMVKIFTELGTVNKRLVKN